MGAIKSRLEQTDAAEQADRQALDILSRTRVRTPRRRGLSRLASPRHIKTLVSYSAMKNAGRRPNVSSRWPCGSANALSEENSEIADIHVNIDRCSSCTCSNTYFTSTD